MDKLRKPPGSAGRSPAFFKKMRAGGFQSLPAGNAGVPPATENWQLKTAAARRLASIEISLRLRAAQFAIGWEGIYEYPRGKFVVKGKQQSCVAAYHFNLA